MPSFGVGFAHCCGVVELAEISTLPNPETVVKAMIEELRKEYPDKVVQRRSFVYFTGVVGKRKKVFNPRFHADTDRDYGQELADFITKEGLGTLTVTPPSRNTSGNMLRMWVWAPDWDATIAVADRAAEATAAPSINPAA